MIKKQQKIQVRIAETGYFDHFLEQLHVSTVGDLIKHYQKMNNNEFISARIFTKGGYMKSRQDLLTQNSDANISHQAIEGQKSHSNGKPAKEKNMKELTYSCANDQNLKTQLKCYYLFTDTMLNKQNDNKWTITQQEAMASLQKKCRQFNQLNMEAFQIKLPKFEIMSRLKESMPMVAAFMTKFHDKYSKFNSLREQLKIISNHIQLTSQKCENQRKAIFVLYTYLEKYIRSLEKKMANLKNQTMKITNQIEHGQSNSLSFRNGISTPISQRINSQIKQRHVEAAICFGKKTQELDESINKLKRLQQTYKSRAKDECKNFHQKLIKANQRISQKCQKMDDIFSSIEDKYIEWKQQVSRLLVGQQDQSKSEQYFFKRIFQKQQDNYIDENIFLANKLINESKGQFLSMFNTNLLFKPLVCQYYRFFDEIYKQFEQKWSQMKDLMGHSNSLLNELIAFNNQDCKYLTDSEQNQFRRRVSFNKELNHLWNKIKGLLGNQNIQRKKYTASMKQHQKVSNGYQIYQILKVDSVPKVQIDYSQSTDQQLVKMDFKTDQDSANCYRGYDQNRVLQELQEYSSKVRNCLIEKERDLPQSVKIRNLIEILQSSSKVYYNVYANKLQSQTIKIKSLQKAIKQKTLKNQKYQNELEEFRSKLTKIERQFDSRALKDGRQIQRLISKGEKLQKQNLELIEQIERLNKQIERKSNLRKDDSQQLQNYSIKVQSLQREKKDFLDKLMKQLKLTQQLSDSHGLIDAENADLKQQLANSHIEIIKLQKQLQALQLSYTIAVNANIDEERDRQRQTKQNQSAFNDQLDSQKAQLKQQIQRLRNRIEQLQDNINQIVNDFKDTQDQSVQVQLQQKAHQVMNVCTQTDLDYSLMESSLVSSRLSLNSVKQGNRCVFLPFDSTTYIAICLPQNSQYGISNTHYLQSSQEKDHFYVLDLKSLPRKAQQLLSECSLIVVAKVDKISHRVEQGCSFVSGKVQYAIGFEDDDRVLKNYSSLLYQQ